MLCCNSTRNGAFIGLCRQLALDQALTLESPWIDRSLKLRIGARDFTLGKTAVFPHRGHSEWAGNWCWNSVWVTHATAADVLNFVVGKGYRPQSGLVSLWDKIDAKVPLTAVDLIAEGVGVRP
jgi:hypothetical protein